MITEIQLRFKYQAPDYWTNLNTGHFSVKYLTQKTHITERTE